jgi:methyl-accepting chemotaxis protein
MLNVGSALGAVLNQNGKNMGIRLKILLSPLIAVALMLMLGGIAFFGVRSIQSSLDYLANQSLRNVTIASEGLSVLLESSSATYRLFTWISSFDNARIKKESDAIVANIDSASQQLKILAEVEGITDSDKMAIEEISAAIVKYRKSVIQAIDMASVDVSLGSGMMQAAEKIFSSIDQQLNQLLEARQLEAKSTLKLANKNASSTNLLTLVLVLVASAISLAIAWRVTAGIMRELGGEPAYAAGIMNQLALGDLTVKVITDEKNTHSLLNATRVMVEQLLQIISQTREVANEIVNSTEQINATAQSLSQASSEQAASVEETSASIEQMSASINQNTENAKMTDGMASQAAKQAIEGGEAVSQTVSAMKQIAGKISIIDDIAYQTNLLALNAAIEAARAGEHGKGFAVVAAEVRKLAERSQIAAQEISELASGSVSKAESAGKLLAEIVPAISKTSDLVQEISAASEEQSSGVGQVNTAMNQLNQISQHNASASEELAATAEEMSGQAEYLQQTMAFFTVEAGEGGSRKATPENS